MGLTYYKKINEVKRNYMPSMVRESDIYNRTKRVSSRSVDIDTFLRKFVLSESQQPLFDKKEKTFVEHLDFNGFSVPQYKNEFWTAKQRQANSIHEISYRACFKAQLPNFFINLLTNEDEVVYDPFSGRGTSVIEAALLNRNFISNDINPLNEILCKPRLFLPTLEEVADRLEKIPLSKNVKNDLDISMFFHPETEKEIVSMRNYFERRKKERSDDNIDEWIRMVATNRLTGHSSGFFSVYSLPPNQAVSQKSQLKINEKRNQKPEYRDTKKIILKKSRDLLKDIDELATERLKEKGLRGTFLKKDARMTKEIPNGSVDLVITSPPFLDVIQYSEDNWLRCWFNSIDHKKISKKITVLKKINEWEDFIGKVFSEFYRIVKKGGYVAFEVGDVNSGKVKLDHHVVPLGVSAGFHCEGIVINEQKFTKTANIWGIKNNSKGTNTNRIVVFRKK